MIFGYWAQRDVLQRKTDGELMVPYGVSFLNEALGGLIPGDIVLVGAKTGVGKTQFATHLALNAAAMHRRVHYLALEAEQYEIERRLLHAEMAKVYWQLPSHARPLGRGFRYWDWRVGKFTDDALIQEIERQCVPRMEAKLENLSIHYRPEGMKVPEFIEMLEQLQLHSDLIILDHFHYFDWDESREYDAIRNTVKKIRIAALKHKLPIVLIAHLRKSDGKFHRTLPEIDDFHGSSDLAKICTTAILIARSKDETRSGLSATHFYIAKSRSAGDAAHYVGTVGYNVNTGSYEGEYLLGRNVAGEVEYKNEHFPSWAVNVKRHEGLSI